MLDLSKSPAIGKQYSQIGKNLAGFRVGKHIVFYRIIKAGEIFIVRILHERMDLKPRMDE
jgi:toxin ParE1/3/4